MGGKGSGGHPHGGNKNTRCDRVDPVLNSRIMHHNRAMMALPMVEFDPKRIMERFDVYLDSCEKYDLKPTVAGTALAMGFDRKRLWEFASGNRKEYKGSKVTPDCVDTFKKIYDFLNAGIEDLLSGEEKNPAKWIFLAKNSFGYSDTKEQLVRTRDETNLLPSAKEVAAEYAKRLGIGQAEIVGVEQLHEKSPSD